MALLEGGWNIVKPCTAAGCTGINEFGAKDLHFALEGYYYGICGACESEIKISQGEIPPGVQKRAQANVISETEERIKKLGGQDKIRLTWRLIQYQLVQGNLTAEQKDVVIGRWKKLEKQCKHPNGYSTGSTPYTEGFVCPDCGYNSNGYAGMPGIG